MRGGICSTPLSLLPLSPQLHSNYSRLLLSYRQKQLSQLTVAVWEREFLNTVFPTLLPFQTLFLPLSHPLPVVLSNSSSSVPISSRFYQPFIISPHSLLLPAFLPFFCPPQLNTIPPSPSTLLKLILPSSPAPVFLFSPSTAPHFPSLCSPFLPFHSPLLPFFHQGQAAMLKFSYMPQRRRQWSGEQPAAAPRQMKISFCVALAALLCGQMC